jgi:NADP-dependent aldehyde dehydrogenase
MTGSSEARVLIGGAWRVAQESLGTFQATNPTTLEPLPEHFPRSGAADLETALDAAVEAQRTLASLPAERIADFLEGYADLLDSHGDALAHTAHLETGLPEATRLRAVELPRTTRQLRLAALEARSRNWRRPVIDTTANLRSLYSALPGPVVVFGPNNFPFAFNAVSGGDFAAAIATGHAVVAKANPGHSATTRQLAELALEALERAGLPLATLQLLYDLPIEAGLKLVADARIGATAFTGSRGAGLRLKAAADAAGKPIYLELGGVNPVFVLPGAWRERAEDIARDLTGSCLLGGGQFCTKPGLIVVPEGGAATLEPHFAAAPLHPLLGARAHEHLETAVANLVQHGAERVTGGNSPGPFRFENTLLRVDAQTFLEHSAALQAEAFGPVCLCVEVGSDAQFLAVVRTLEGGLTGTVYSALDGSDDPLFAPLAAELRHRVGRLLEDRVPTGVAVSPAMNHGGPFPATAHPGFTAVGLPTSLYRFAALWSYDHARPEHLPPELRDENTLGLWRQVDGEWTKDNVPPAKH